MNKTSNLFRRPALFRRQQRLFRMDRFQKFLVVFMTLFSLLMLIPLVYIFNNALKPFQELFAFPPTLFVRHPTLHNFLDLIAVTQSSVTPISRYLFNSIVVTGLAVVGVTVVSGMCAYPLSKMKFPGHNLVFGTILLTLMFAPEAVSTTRYIVVTHIGIMNTYWAHLLPLMAAPVAVFLFKQFMDQIPNELLEAGKMDGAKELTVFFKIVIPMCMPAVATVAILTFQAAWSNTETSSLFMQDESMKTFSFYISTLVSGASANIARTGTVAAAGLILFIPNLIIFLIFQRKVIATMAHSGIK
ncbi:carbohydrate ABC transporter permease [Cohnella yongneupensis]|uniref:Carbohydrate ABC transporter permease n=1 Tax=Cohnella yongneupensis TaxID=425006 RepID=A0ABW0R5N5_9BACL